MDPMKLVMAGLLVAASSLSPGDFPASVYSQEKKSDKKPGTTKIDPKTAKKLREARIKDIRKKIDNIGTLIQSVNSQLKLRTSGPAVFDQKRSLENQLRDLITLFALTTQALTEAGRLSREVGDIKRHARKGPRDTRRLQLANFLDARRTEYIIFGTR
ncbi:MAG TPA: hypothetical protein DDZ83_10905 [Nitrospinae bacterium]|nr:hypothetical protein [Nitrospinota bacterium]